MRDMGFVVDWADLPADVLGLIARCLPMMEDVAAFRGVCTGWKAAAPKDKCLSVSKVPVLMLSEKPGKTQPREFYSLSKRKICMRKHLPEVKNKRCIDVGFGWLLVLSTRGCAFLFKPFSSAPRIELPGYKKFPRWSEFHGGGDYKLYFILKGVLTSNPSVTSNFKLVLGSLRGMGVWKNGDDNWSPINAQFTEPVLRRNGKMYKLCPPREGKFDHMEVWDLHGTYFSKPEAIVPVCNIPNLRDRWQHYLLESTDGELLLIIRNNAGFCTGYFEAGSSFGVMRVDLVKGKCEEITSLGKDAIFVGNNVSVAVDATEFPGVLKPNCIYFTDDRWEAYTYKKKCPNGGGKDMGIYNVRDGSIERFGVESFSDACPPLWVFPSF